MFFSWNVTCLACCIDVGISQNLLGNSPKPFCSVHFLLDKFKRFVDLNHDLFVCSVCVRDSLD